MKLTFKRVAAAASVAAALAATAGSASAAGLVGLTDNNVLLTFNSTAPGVVSSAATISGLGAGESIISIDYRNPDNTIYGLSTLGKLYALNASTGVAVSVGSSLVPTVTAGVSYEIDWNPSNNNLRLTGNGAAPNSNSAYTFATGVTAVQTPLSRADGGGALDVIGVAYNNNVHGSTTTTLSSYFIDASSDALFVNTNAFAGGVLTKVGDLTLGGFAFGVSGASGFEINGAGEAFISLRENLYALNLGTGALTPLGSISATNYNVIGLTSVTAVPEPQTYALMLAGLAAVGFLARRRQG